MAGTLKVDNLNADSNLALKIANTAVGYIDSTGLRIVNGNLVLNGTTVSSTQLSQLNANGTISASAIASVNASVATTGTLPYARLPSGSVLQVVNATYTTQQSTTSATFADTGLTASITPKFSSSKILVLVTHSGILTTGAVNALGNFRIYRDSTNILQFGAVGRSSSSSEELFGAVVASYLDSPSTTSSVTYKTQFNNKYASGTVYFNAYDPASTITLMEIAG